MRRRGHCGYTSLDDVAAALLPSVPYSNPRPFEVLRLRKKVTLVSMDQLAGFPGAELVRKGLEDLASGAVTEEACLASIASPRLMAHGFLPADAVLISEAEIVLYRLLGGRVDDPYSYYNSLLRRLVRFEHTLDRRQLPVSAV